MSYSRFVGNWFIGLGILSVAGMAVSLALAYWLDSFCVDLSFIIWFWLGRELRARNPTARKWAIGISLLGCGLVLFAFTLGVSSARAFGVEFARDSHWYYVIGLVLVVLLLPGLILLTKKAKREFSSQGTDQQAQDDAPR